MCHHKKTIKKNNMDSPELRYKKINDILKKFKNGDGLYKKNPVFHYVIQMLLEGMDEYEVIEELVKINKRTHQAFEDYVNRDTRPMLLNLKEKNSAI